MRRMISDICLTVLLPLWLLVCAAQAQFNSFPPGVFTGRASIDAAASGGGLLLDNLSATALVAFSTRKLRTAYAGTAMTVERSSDMNTQNIGFASNNFDTTSLHTFITTNSGSINSWLDQAGSNNTTVESLATQPLIINAGTDQTINGHICPTWAAASNSVQHYGGSITQAQPISIAILFKYNTTPISGAHLHDGATARPLIGTGTGPVYQLYAGSSVLSGGTPNTSIHTIVGLFNGASSSLLLDGSSIISGNPGTNAYAADVKVMGRGSSTPDVNICEFIAFSSSISGTDQSTIRSSWQTYWGAP